MPITLRAKEPFISHKLRSKHFKLNKVYTDEGGTKIVIPLVREIIRSLKFVDYLSYKRTNRGHTIILH